MEDGRHPWSTQVGLLLGPLAAGPTRPSCGVPDRTLLPTGLMVLGEARGRRHPSAAHPSLLGDEQSSPA
jgi:hypothetical protein